MVYQYGEVVSEPKGVAAMRIRDVVLKSWIQMRFAMCRPVSSPIMICVCPVFHHRNEKA